jgi:hypothetical protein
MMTDSTNQFLKTRLYFVHNWLLRAGENVNAEQFCHVFSQDAPAIGWHLWHMARFADRLQSKLAHVTDGEIAPEIWYHDNVSILWDVSAEKLGVFESGMGQAHEDAQAIMTQVGQSATLHYAKTVFDRCNARIKAIAEADFDNVYFGILDYGYDPETGVVWATEPIESTVGQDLIFHVTHGSRHMGMMEALTGLLGSAGTLSV